jgi:hypothetical protein
MRMSIGILLVALAVTGCDATSSPPASVHAIPPLPARHSELGTQHSVLSGRVVWSGPRPHADPVTSFRGHPEETITPIVRPAPNVPAVEPTGGVAGAVVYLRCIESATQLAHGDLPTAPWAPVTVELHDERPMIRQGDDPLGTIGFVRSGDEISIVSRQSLFHSLRARGAAFWTVTLPDSDRPRTRRLDRPGLVELSSGANYYWMRGYVWVCEHPFFVATDTAGHWELRGVPAGTYDLVAWLPDWRTERQERDPETGLISRYVFRPPYTVTRRVKVGVNDSLVIGDVQINP